MKEQPAPAPKITLPTLEDVKPKDKPEQWATDEDFEDIQRTFDHLAKKFKKSDLERADNRFPVYVIMSSKTQLEAQHGPNTADIVDGLLQDLAGKIGSLPDWGAQVFYPDDATQMAALGLKPTIASDAWKVKLSLGELDEALGKQGEMIGALLIVGGPEIIPFHNLPNPTYDNDLDVPSDNPYSTVDENYFIPQWPVGRLPGETGSDAGLLIFQIRNLIYKYEQRTKKGFNPGARLSTFFARIRQWITNFGIPSSKKQSMGYSAEVWKEASAGVYSTIGKAKDLQLSPPTNTSNIAPLRQPEPLSCIFQPSRAYRMARTGTDRRISLLNRPVPIILSRSAQACSVKRCPHPALCTRKPVTARIFLKRNIMTRCP